MGASGVDLIRKMAAGDAESFAAFYEECAPLAYSVMVRIARAPADAADVLQETFWEAWQGAASYDPARGSPEAWIVTRARSRAIDRVRSIRRRSETFVAPVDEGVAASRSEPEAPDPSAVTDRMAVESLLD